MQTLLSDKEKRALFLDRDGVINVEKNYVYRVEDFEFMNGIFDLCRAAIQHGMLIVVVTNQAGIGRGLYTEDQFHELNNWMIKRFIEEGAPIAAVYFCPYHPVYGRGKYRMDSLDRKPNPGMLFRARDALSLSLSASILIGDKETDIEAAKRAGIGSSVLISKKKIKTAADARVVCLPEALEILFSGV